MKRIVLFVLFAAFSMTADISAQTKKQPDPGKLQKIHLKKEKPGQLSLQERREFKRLTRLAKADGRVTRGEMKVLRQVRKRQLRAQDHHFCKKKY